MKTIFQRGLSLIMCLILICSTASVMAFGAGAAEPYSYKTYAQNATKENVHYLLDLADDELDKANKGKEGNKKNLEIEVTLIENNSLAVTLAKPILNIFLKGDAIKVVDNEDLILSLNLSSVDNICKTLDNYRVVIELASNETLNKLLDLGHLKNINLDVFDEGMSRAKSGDVKIFSEILELGAANSEIIRLLLSGELDLGVIGDAVKLDLSSFKIGETAKNAIVDALFKDKENYATIKADALKDFDRFVYRDVIGLLSKDIVVDEKTTIDNLITDVFNILVNDYIIGLVKDKSFSFASLGSEYAKLDTIIQIDGSYDFSKIKFTKDTTVLNQINNVLGSVFVEIVPGFKDKWVAGNYTKIGDNVRNLVKYIASSSGLINVNGKSDEALMLEVFKIVFNAADTNGEKEIYEAIKDVKTLTQMVDKIVIHLSGKAYPAGTTYEQVAGDWLIDKVGDTVPLYDTKGQALTANGKNTVWDVLNSVLNFFLVDKNLDAFFGWKASKGQTFFEKLDIILDYTANDGTANFNSKTYITSLLNSVFTVNLQSFVDLTAVKALNFAGKEPVVKFLYNTVYNLLNNWTARSGLTRQTSDYFDKMLSDGEIANIVKIVIKTLSSRSEATASLVGVVFGAIKKDINENITEAGLVPTCTKNGYAPTKRCTRAACNNAVISDKNDVIASRGHRYTSVVTTAAKCAVDGVKTHTCTVCGDKYTTKIAKTGHKLGAWKVTKAATYTTKGWQERRCTVKGCNALLASGPVNMLTLSRPTGLKAKAISTTSIQYSWNPVKGATSYTLYYKTNTGSWKSVTVKNGKTTVKVSKLKKGLTYKFKVVAVAGSNKSKESAIVDSTTMPVAVTFKGLRSQKKKEIVVEWKKISGVTGYEVQYATDKKFKKNKKTVTIKKAGTTKTIIKKLKSKKKYFVRVRAYKTVNKVKVYGAYSKVRNIKCK